MQNIFQKKKYFYLSIIAVLICASIVRLYKLGEIPHGMTWDEAAIGYNGYAILHTRRDEWLQKLPVSFRSFGDYKAPLAIYGNGVFTYVFGMSVFAVRLPFALAGIATVLGIMVLVWQLWPDKKQGRSYALVVGFGMAFSPWHLHFSRAGFESGIGLCLLVWALVCIYQYIYRLKYWQLAAPLGAVLLSLSLYAYHSNKIVVPLLLAFLLLSQRKRLASAKKVITSSGLLGTVISLPLIKDMFAGSGFERAGVTIFAQSDSIMTILQTLLTNIYLHLHPNFLIFGQTTSLRHGDGRWGVLFATTFVLFVVGIIQRKLRSDAWHLGLALTIFGLMPAVITFEVPHSNRALLALPGFLILSLHGVHWLIDQYKNRQHILKASLGVLVTIHLFLFVSYQHEYYTNFSRASAEDFKDGYIEAFQLAKKYEDGTEGYPEVDKIIFTTDYGQPYIYALFVRQTNPIWYRGGSLIKYEFTDTITVGDLERHNTLVVASESDALPESRADHLVRGSDGQVRFKLYKTK